MQSLRKRAVNAGPGRAAGHKKAAPFPKGRAACAESAGPGRIYRTVSPKKQGRRTIPGRWQRGHGPDRSENDAGEKNIGEKASANRGAGTGCETPAAGSRTGSHTHPGKSCRPARRGRSRTTPGGPGLTAAPSSRPRFGEKGSFGEPAAGGGMRRRYAFS